jgi:hypothetical protein
MDITIGPNMTMSEERKGSYGNDMDAEMVADPDNEMADAEIEDTDNEMEDHENEMLVPQDDEEVDDDGNVVDMAILRAMLHHFQGDDKLLKEYMCALMACTTKSSPCARHCRHEQNFHPIFSPREGLCRRTSRASDRYVSW